MHKMKSVPSKLFIKSFQAKNGREKTVVIIITHIVHLSWKRFSGFSVKIPQDPLIKGTLSGLR